MASLFEDPENKLEEPLLLNEGGLNSQIREKHIIKKTIMKTPCNHRFHIKCLLEWMNLKLECPICRKKLPSLE